MSNKLQGRIALITGASRGIGAAIAKRYAEEGAHVLLVARTLENLEKVDDYIQEHTNGKSTIIPFDLCDFEKIDQLAHTLIERFGRLDILVGNAGVLGSLRPITNITEKIWNEVIDTNLNANWRLIRALDPLLRESDSGRVIFVTSGVTQSNDPFWGPYMISKTALETMAKIYATETKTTNIKVNLVDPGIVATKIREDAMPGEDPETLPQPESVTEMFVNLATKAYEETGQRKNVA